VRREQEKMNERSNDRYRILQTPLYEIKL